MKNGASPPRTSNFCIFTIQATNEVQQEINRNKTADEVARGANQ